MDPMFLQYSPVNGVPQESKLATYMKRQTEGPPIHHSITKTLSNLSLSDSSVSLKKVVLSQNNEFIPRSCTSGGVSSGSGQCLVPTVATAANAVSPPPAINNSSPTPTAVPTYQENVGGTTYFYSAATTGAEGVVDDGGGGGGAGGVGGGGGAAGGDSQLATMFPGTPSHIRTAQATLAPIVPTTSEDSYFISNQLRLEIHHRNNMTLMQSNSSIYPDLPVEVDNYHELCPLEPMPNLPKPHMIAYQTSNYKATHVKTGLHYCLRRVHGFRLPNTKCMILVDMWKKLSHSNIVQLREVFTTKAFGDQSIIFVYDYHPDSDTLLSRHFSQAETLNGYSDSFSSNPNAPRPYSHQKNAILRQQHSNGMLSEATIWSYVIQLTGALCVIHSAGLACRCLDPSKVIQTGRNRLRVTSTAIVDVLTFDSTATNPLALIPHYQQEDLNALGKLVLALACRSLMAVQRENLQTSLDLMSRTYSSDLRNLIIYLLSGQQRRSVVDLMPMIGARYYSQLDTVQLHNDILYTDLAKEMENGRLFRLLVKLGTMNERPELNMDPTWSETGDRYMLKLLRDYLFHQVTQDGRPFLDMAHVVHSLNKLDAGTQEKVCLMSRDEQSILVVSYAELKQCLEQSFAEIVASASSKPDIA